MTEPIIFIHPVSHDFKKDDLVIDLTAKENGWPDDEGVVDEVDGSHVCVQYSSGTKRWKAHINIQRKK